MLLPAAHVESYSLFADLCDRWINGLDQSWALNNFVTGKPRARVACPALVSVPSGRRTQTRMVTRPGVDGYVFSVEHRRQNRKQTVVLVAGPCRFRPSKIATLRVTLRGYNFLSNPLKTRNAAKSRRMRALIWRGRRGSNPRPPA